MDEYLSPKKRAQVDAIKARIVAGELDTGAPGSITPTSTTITDLIQQAIYQDEQGPWSVEDHGTELDIAQYELAIEQHDREIEVAALRLAAQIVKDSAAQGLGLYSAAEAIWRESDRVEAKS